jgi:hypothetical protein
MDLSDAAVSGFNIGSDIASQWKRNALELQLASQRKQMFDAELSLATEKFDLEKQQINRINRELEDPKSFSNRQNEARTKALELDTQAKEREERIAGSIPEQMYRDAKRREMEAGEKALTQQAQTFETQRVQLEEAAKQRTKEMEMKMTGQLSDLLTSVLPLYVNASPEQRAKLEEGWINAGELGTKLTGLLGAFRDVQVSPDDIQELDGFIRSQMTGNGPVDADVVNAYASLQMLMRGKPQIETIPAYFDETTKQHVPARTELFGGKALAEMVRRFKNSKASSSSAPGLTTDEVWSKDSQRDMQIKERVGKIRPERLLDDLRDISNDLSLLPEEKKKLFKYASQGPLVSQWQQHIKRKKNEQGPNRTTAQDRF